MACKEKAESKENALQGGAHRHAAWQLGRLLPGQLVKRSSLCSLAGTVPLSLPLSKQRQCCLLLLLPSLGRHLCS